MIKQINKLLKLVGLNLVRAKRKNRTRPNPNYRPIPVNQECPKVPLSDYMGDAEWQDTGKTHYVGDDCPGGHQNICIGPKAKVQVVDLDAAFVPVDTDERPRVEQPSSVNDVNGTSS